MVTLLSLPFSDRRPSRDSDDAMTIAVLHERALRELRMRSADDWQHISAGELSIASMIPARDAGDVCDICGEIVTWTDHLPPLDADGAVRCFKNVVSLRRDVELDDIFRGV